jgi:membrane peptidoglycan carboxypeptidase
MQRTPQRRQARPLSGGRPDQGWDETPAAYGAGPSRYANEPADYRRGSGYGARGPNGRNGGNGRNGRGNGGGASRGAVAFPLLLFGVLVFVAAALFITAVGAYAYYSRGLDDPQKLEAIEFIQETVLYDRTGKTELARFGTERREVVTFEQVAPVAIDATTAIEDKSFWSNTGFDAPAIADATLDTLTGDRERGASTITQQLVRQRLLDSGLVQDDDRKVERKVKELIQSVRLSQAYPGDEGKRKIITAYLNQNFYGNNSYGIKAAARGYFGVTDLNKLTLAQAAILAGIPQSPVSYDLVRNAIEEEVDGKTRLVVPPDAAIVQRRNHILDLMAQGRTPLTGSKYGPTEFEAARNEPVVLASQAEPNWRAPHYVWAVREELTRELCGERVATCPQIERGGLRVTTTLDLTLQKAAERWVTAAAILPHVKGTTPEKYAKTLGVPYANWLQRLRTKDLHNGALVAMDYQTGEVVAYVGSAGYYQKRYASKKFQPQFDVLRDGWRQPGSAFKPFNYVTGIHDKKITAASMFMDVVTDFGGGYTPTDADNLERGPVRMRNALQFSLNIPAIKALAYNGIERVFEVSQKFGMQFQTDKPTAGLSLTLGTQEVHPVDLTTAYGTLANRGGYVGRSYVLAVKDGQGKDVLKPYKPPKAEQIVSPHAAYIVTDVLAGNTNPSVNPYWGDFAIQGPSGRRRPATLKTGTNNDAKDLNAYGYIAPPDEAGRKKGEYALVVGAWNGNSDNSIVSKPGEPLFSIDVTTYVWEGFMEEATKKWAINDFARPDGLREARVDAFFGTRGGPSSRTVNELFLAGTGPEAASGLTRTLKVVTREEAAIIEPQAPGASPTPTPTPRATPRPGAASSSSNYLIWQEGCNGTPEDKAFLNISEVEAQFPAWQKADREWARRAERGPGVSGGPEGTRTAYFYNGGYRPYGSSWGAPFPPTEKCTIQPATPKPTPSPTPTPTPPPEPSPSPSESPSPVPEESESPEP